jgi:hypothetical protein
MSAWTWRDRQRSILKKLSIEQEPKLLVRPRQRTAAR